MGQDRASAALRRIEMALARIEAAATAPRAAAGPSSAAHGNGHGDGEGHEALVRAHLALRTRVEGAIAQIDGLLEAEDGL